MSLRRFIACSGLLLFLGLLTPHARAQVVYWCNQQVGCFDDGISQADLEDAIAVFLHRGRCSPIDIALDVGVNALYWSDVTGIHRSAQNGDNPAVIVPRTTAGWLGALAIDAVGEKLFWTDGEFANILRANLNGTNVETVVPNIGVSLVLYLDASARKLYWVEQGTVIYRANLNGSGKAPVRSALVSGITGIAVDPVGAMLYWSEEDGGVLRSALDGSGPEVIVAGRATSLYLAVAERKVYWTATRVVMRSDLDGGNAEPVVVWMPGDFALAFPFYGLAVDNRVPGDCDGDGQRSLSDMGTFADCLGGPERATIRGCGCADIDRNGIMTLTDYAAFQLAIGE